MTLTSAQNSIVENARGHFLVRACPGSGKTYTLAVKAARDREAWVRLRSGLALLSFTNTAQTEIQEEIERVSGNKLVYPHYVGTIDAFINKYIFFPYIHLLGYDATTIKMVGEPYTRNYGRSLKQECALKLKYNPDGSYINPTGSKVVFSKEIISDGYKVKAAMLKDGQFTQADANYFALEILRKHEEIRDVVSVRFPVIYLDEAQDTTPVHWEVLKLLTARSSNEVFGVIGDPDQSIYGWNGAKPEIFIEHQESLEKEGRAFKLNDCRRSSQVLCNFYHKFSTLEDVPLAIDPEVKDLNTRPHYLFYSGVDEISSIVGAFKSSHKDEEILMVSRSMTIVDRTTRLESVNPEAIDQNPFSAPKAYIANIALDIMHARADYDARRYANALYRAESIYFARERIYNREDFLEECGLSLREWYQQVEADILQMPDSNLTVEKWVEAAEDVKTKTLLFSHGYFKVKARGKLDYKNTRCGDFFKDSDALDVERQVETVHSTKGKTTDHVLVILDDAQARRVINVLNGKDVSNSEEKRIFYVAISRARKTVTICLPSKYEDDLKIEV